LCKGARLLVSLSLETSGCIMIEDASPEHSFALPCLTRKTQAVLAHYLGLIVFNQAVSPR